MKSDSRFIEQSLEFWTNVKLISQKIGYTDRKTSLIKVPNINEIILSFEDLQLNSSKIIINEKITPFGNSIIEYFQYRADILENYVEKNLLNKDEAEKIFEKLKKKYKPNCPLPVNKQKGDKKTPAFFTCIINILIEANSKGYKCNYNPTELPAFTKDQFPIRNLSRRVDGAFPGVINPLAVWEIKEYYSTTTFGSRVADGVYESLLDGTELSEIRNYLQKDIYHYLMVDDYFTWWTLGKSYLCRICDMLNMGLLTEAIFGKEVIEAIPRIVNEWVKQSKMIK